MSDIRLTLHALCWFLPFFQCSAFSLPSSSFHNITQDSLEDYVTTVPNQQAQAWIDQQAHFLAFLARMPFPLYTWPEKYANGNWHLYKRGIKNYGYTNYIFQIPDSDYWVQIGGPKHRVRNLYTYNTNKNSYWYSEIIKHWELRNELMLNKFTIVPTYQTVSRFANYLLLDETIEQLDCAYIRIAPTYLVHIPGLKKSISDEHYIVVQKNIAGIERLREVPQRIEDIPDQALVELFNVICATGYWNIKNGLYVDPNNNLVLLDYEQHNIENPKDFFFKDLQSFEECVFNGIEELALIHLKPHVPNKYERLLWLIASDKMLYKSILWPNYMALLDTR